MELTQQNINLVKTNKVLSQTYKLLALSLIPTILGSIIGIVFNLTAILNSSAFLTTIVYLVVSFGLMYLVGKNKNNVKGIYFLFAFTFFSGLMLSQILQHALAMANGAKIIAMAGGSTALSFFIMSAIGNNSQKNYSNLGQFLFTGLILIVIASIINIFLQLSILHLVICSISIIIFSAYIIYDINRIVRGGENNYVMATLSLYLNVFNLFIDFLNLFLSFEKN